MHVFTQKNVLRFQIPKTHKQKRKTFVKWCWKGVNDCSKPTAGCLTCELSPYCVSILKHKLFRPSRIECRSRQKSRFSGYISGVLHSSHSWDQNLWKVSSGTFTGQKVTESMTYKHIRTNKKMAEKHNYLAYFIIQIKKDFFLQRSASMMKGYTTSRHPEMWKRAWRRTGVRVLTSNLSLFSRTGLCSPL